MPEMILIEDWETAERVMKEERPVYLTNPDPSYVLGPRGNNPRNRRGKITEVINNMIFVDWGLKGKTPNLYDIRELSYKEKPRKIGTQRKKLKLDNLYAKRTS